MLAMDQIYDIRKLFYEQGLNISEIARKTGRDWKTVQKYVDMTDFNEVDPMPEPKQLCSKLDPFKPKIDEWLQEDRKASRSQRHTAKKVHDRLEKEVEGFNCSYSLVAEYVKVKKKELNLKRPEGFIPLIHQPGEAQGDFGTAGFIERGVYYTGKHFTLAFPYSNNGYLQLHRGENTECLLESLKAIFEYIGGVPTEIWFDNTSTIVTKIIKGGGRELTERFTRFMEHYGFAARFMNPYSGHEKGSVENKVGYLRRNLLVPVPRFMELAQFNRQLLLDCDKDADREHYRHKEDTISGRFEVDRKAFLPLPDVPFDTASYQRVSTDKWGKLKLDNGRHTYSVSPGQAEQEVWVKITAEFVTIMNLKHEEIVTHSRLYGDKEQESMQWLPYLKYIARRPRSLRNSGIYSMLPESMRSYLDRCEKGDCGKILKTLSELTERTGFDSAVQTVNQAIIYQANDEDSLRNLYRCLYSDVPTLPPLAPQEGIPTLTQMPSGLSDYDALLHRGCSA